MAARTWTQLKGGIPTIQVRDMTVQKREHDLVLGTFGRGFYVLDDYSPLREPHRRRRSRRRRSCFPLRHAYRYDVLTQQNAAWGNVATPNPPYGALFTYHVGPGFTGNLALAVSDESGTRAVPDRGAGGGRRAARGVESARRAAGSAAGAAAVAVAEAAEAAVAVAAVRPQCSRAGASRAGGATGRRSRGRPGGRRRWRRRSWWRRACRRSRSAATRPGS